MLSLLLFLSVQLDQHVDIGGVLWIVFKWYGEVRCYIWGVLCFFVVVFRLKRKFYGFNLLIQWVYIEN